MGEEIKSLVPPPISGGGYDCKDAGGRATHGAVAEGEGDKTKEGFKVNKLLKQRSRDLRKNLTDAEQKLWQKLRNKQIDDHKFRRQFVLGNYIVDFICIDKRLIVEVDGGQHMDNVDYDLQRDEWLKKQNFKVLRFWNNQVLSEIDSVLEVIVKNLE